MFAVVQGRGSSVLAVSLKKRAVKIKNEMVDIGQVGSEPILSDGC